MLGAWSLLAIESDHRQFIGNEGYDDSLGSYYSWDSTVPNHARPGIGDLIAVRNEKSFLGWAFIEHVDTRKGSKIRRRCPSCGKTNFRERSKHSPRFRCSCSFEFEHPTEQTLEGVTMYRAWYENTWREFEQPFSVADLSDAYLSQAAQHSIRPLNGAEWLRLTLLKPGPDTQARAERLWKAIQGGHVLRVTRSRVGQQKFRQQLQEHYGWNCAITGPAPAVTLEAAHLYRYSEKPVHDEKGGLLLRRDIHALFDYFLLAIEPESGTTRVAPSLSSYTPLAALEGETLKIPEAHLPDRELLNSHLEKSLLLWELAM